MAEKRTPNPALLTLSLLASPAIAGMLAALLIVLSLAIMTVNDPYTTAPNPGFALGIAGIAVIAMIVGAVTTYSLGVPFIIAGWAIAHFFTARSMIHFIGTMALAGVAFAYLIFFYRLTLFDPQDPYMDLSTPLLVILIGLVSGAVVGATISLIGYQRAPTPA